MNQERGIRKRLPTAAGFGRERAARPMLTEGIPGGWSMRLPVSWPAWCYLAGVFLLAGLFLPGRWPDAAAGEDQPKPPVLRQGSEGKWVEVLQRTLNARAGSKKPLAVDGSFGPATRARVEEFQQAQGLTPTGVVDEATWKALGPPVMEEPAVPAPAVVNAQVLPKAPADSLDGPPAVACKAWVIGDSETGKVLAGHNDDSRLQPASVTKIMTAYLICRRAADDPKLLDEEVVFSERAAKTTGSSSRVRAGEKVPAGELLYGLMLPSGNDAAVAFAEHFGKRFSKDGARVHDPVEAFVGHMNEVAEQLGLKDTHYENPHGLPHPKHLTSARDLLRLSAAGMKLPLFRTVVGMRQHGCRVTDDKGQARNLVWKNTNELLGIEGYTGIKTGTTTAAACLVAGCRRDGVERIVVVLGATSGESRYTETRNLFRWGWREFPAAKKEK
jgi:D-alanyl-D-alanine carboxypeptidase (penicillin-binding protein 5/6)